MTTEIIIGIRSVDYLLDDDTENDPLRFKDVEDAKSYLLDVLEFDEEDLKDIVFEDVLANPDRARLADHMKVMGVEEHTKAMAAWISTTLDPTTYDTMIDTKDFGRLWQDYYKNVVLPGEVSCFQGKRQEYRFLQPSEHMVAGDEVYVMGTDGVYNWEEVPYTEEDKTYPVGNAMVRRATEITEDE